MTEKIKEKTKEVTIQQILDEGKKEKHLSLGGGRVVKYVDPTNKETKALETEVKNEIVNDRRRFYLTNPNPSKEDLEAFEKDSEEKTRRTLSRLTLWKGLNKADSSVTREMIDDLPSSLTLGVELQLVGEQFEGLDEERLGKLKSLREVTKALT